MSERLETSQGDLQDGGSASESPALDLTIAVLLTVLFAVMLVMSPQMGLMKGGVPQPGLFPLVVASVGLVSSATVMILKALSLVRREASIGAEGSLPAPRAEQADSTSGPMADLARLELDDDGDPSMLKVLGAVLALAIPVFATTWIGLIASFILMSLVLTRFVMRSSWMMSLVVSVAAPLATYVLFDSLLGVEFPVSAIGLR